ncbi:MAG: zinc ribbon domain-containing protein [Pseudonocardia sp.]|nr:zinc ribbon domain-containing protein [Pseudonocardia sp.]
MATYSYRCAVDGAFDVRLPMGKAPSAIDCPRCGMTAPRRFAAPMLGLAHRGALAALDRAEASRSEPAVVSAPPRRPRRQAARLDPRAARLPRP